MTLPGPPVRDIRIAALLVGLLAALVYANSLGNEFAYDDVHIIVENEAVHSLETLPNALAQPYWPDLYGRELGLWRPFTTAVLGVTYAAGGGDPTLFHVVNVALHVIATILVLLLGAALMPLLPALVAALVFAVHPLHVEAVANAVGVAELLSAVGILAACWVHVRSPDRSPWRHALAIGGLYAVAFGAKESGVTLPGLLFLIDAVRKRIAPRDVLGYLRDRWRLYLVLVGVACAMLAGRYAVLDSVASPFAPVGADLLVDVPRIWTLGEVWTHYVRLWVLPVDLSAEYSPNVIPISLGWHATNVVGVLVVLGVLMLALWAWRGSPSTRDSLSAKAAAFGIVWFAIAISPISNVFFLSGVLLAERTLYLPSVGLALTSGWLILRLAEERPKVAWAVLALALVAGSWRTWARNPTWHDNGTMFTTLLDEVPHSGRSQWILGDEFLRTGNVSQALLSYRVAIDILGGHYTLVTHVAQKLLEIGRYRSAEQLFRFAWQDAPQFALAPSQLAWIRAQHGDAVGTELWARESLALYPEDPTRLHLLAWALATQDRWDEARDVRERADTLGRSQVWQYWAYTAYRRLDGGDTLGAIEALDSAWAVPSSALARLSLDSIRVTDFGREPLGGASVGAPARATGDM